MQKAFSRFAGVFLFSLLVVTLAFGQSTTGTISGTVVDQQSGAIPGATVTARHMDTNQTRTATTDAEGRFSFPGLPVGNYELVVEFKGFAKYVRGPIWLELNRHAIVPVTMQPSTVAETVNVTEDAPLLNTSSPEVGVRFDEKRIIDLPTLPSAGGGFRDVFAYALSAPGVSQLNSGNSVFAAGTNFSVNGMRPRGNNFMIDGQDSNDPSVTGRTQVMNNPEIVQEFRLITNQFAAEYGRAAGSVVNIITKSGTNSFHGSAFWFHNDNALNSCSNLDYRGGLSNPAFCSQLTGGNRGAPFRIENQFGGTLGGPIIKDKTFFFGSVQRWTDRVLGSGTSISGVPTDAGKTLLGPIAATRPQVQALLDFVPGAATQGTGGGNPTFAAFCINGGTLPDCTGGTRINVPTGTITGAAAGFFNNWQGSGRIDHKLSTNHNLSGRYLYNDSISGGTGQATPPGLTTQNVARQQALTVNLTSTLTPTVLNELRTSWQRLATNTGASDPSSESIPSIEVPEMGLTGFNAAASRTAIGLAVNLPQFRFNNTYQLQDTIAWTRGSHAFKFGIDFRRVDVKSFFFPTIRGRLNYPTSQTGLGLAAGTVGIQNYIDDVAAVLNVNRPLPGGAAINYYKWDDYFFFAQDTWQVRPSFTLTLGLRYEAPGNALASLYPLNDSIVATNSGQSVFLLNPRPSRDLNNFQPRFGFAWNPRTRDTGIIGMLTGGNRFVIRGGYSRTNDYQFINLALNVASSFPFVAAIDAPGPTAWSRLQTVQPNLSNPVALNLLTRTVLDGDFRSPIAEQFSLEMQRELGQNTVIRVGYVGTKGTGLFQTLDGNPTTRCTPIPAGTTPCPRVNPLAGVIRLRANAGSSIYHSMQVSFDRRFSNGFSMGAHWTWSMFIDTASDTFNPSARGEVAVAQDSFNPRADRGRSTYDRPQRFSLNAVYELPFYRSQQGFIGHILGGWQVAGFLTFQSGSPFTPLNGSDPGKVLTGISGLVGDAVRPNYNTNLPVWKMSIPDLIAAGGASLFSTITAADRIGNVGRNILRADGIGNLDFSIQKSTRVFGESHRFTFRVDFFNMTNTRNFGIPEARVSAGANFLDEGSTDGGNRRIFFGLRYSF